MDYLISLGEKAKKAKKVTAVLTAQQKNNVLFTVGKMISQNCDYILRENEKDIKAAVHSGVKGAYIDRLTLTKERIVSIVEGLEQTASLDDPIGNIVSMNTMPNGLIVGQKRVPIGVIGIIYEARPNVTADAFGLCFKAGSVVLLRGGKEAFNSNKALVETFRNALENQGIDKDVVQLLEDTTRETAAKFMKLNDYIDLLIPRGGAGLIKTVVENSTIPVIETGTGNCHIYVDEWANLQQAIDIVVNAKVQRPGVCNACEKLIIHQNIVNEFLPLIIKELKNYNVEIRGDERVVSFDKSVMLATEEDWPLEYLDYIIAIKIVNSYDEGVSHIQKYSSGHSEAIITENYTNSQNFLEQIDSACVYVNASTRFTDGFMFGFGAEIGISTQKLHARGPMGLKELTSTKYIIYGQGQTRV